MRLGLPIAGGSALSEVVVRGSAHREFFFVFLITEFERLNFLLYFRRRNVGTSFSQR